MSWNTTADDRLESARQKVQAAIEDLSQICIHQCDGHDDYNTEFKGELHQAFFKLVEVRKMISR